MDTSACQIRAMLAEEFPPTEAPTRPIGPRPIARAESAPARRTHLMLVGTPRLSLRGLTWLRRSTSADFDGIELQRMITLERLSLG